MRDPGLRTRHEAELQVGALVIVSVIALIAGLLWITGTDLGGEAIRVHAATDDAAQVSSGSRVFLHGVDIGSVERVTVSGRGAFLDLAIEPPGSLPRDSRGVIQASGFLGDQMVKIVPGTSERPLTEGDTIRAATSPDLQAMAGELGSDAEELMERARRLISEETVSDLRQSSRSLSGAMRELETLIESERARIASVVANLDRLSARMSSTLSGPELESSLAHIDSLSGSLVRTSAVLDTSTRSLASILEKVDEGRGSLGRLVNDEQLYDRVSAAAADLRMASEEIGLLTRDIRERPARYLGEMKFSVF